MDHDVERIQKFETKLERRLTEAGYIYVPQRQTTLILGDIATRQALLDRSYTTGRGGTNYLHNLLIDYPESDLSKMIFECLSEFGVKPETREVTNNGIFGGIFSCYIPVADLLSQPTQTPSS